MSSAASTSTPLPSYPSAVPSSHHAPDANFDNIPDSALSDETSKVIPDRKPLLRLELRDLSSNGSRAFLRLVHASVALQDAVDTVLNLLYRDLNKKCIPPTRSITLVIREMEGVAYTTGRDIDDDHKEIHLNTKYIEQVPESRQKEEILGVLVHEMVHCWQHSGLGTAPVGLTEGVADWVRLKAGFAPPHWKRHTDCDWDAGYERTGYFLEWLEKEHGIDVVRRINEAMRGCEYNADKVWHGCCGMGVKKLWKEYKKDNEDKCEE
ncbi:peptidase of plants and bacteria-domain-containing protein [Phaeosphaeriaceae sp. PMI808]|nr:peptidase of plants and bacteria-domain-containing protein [Phaeosphaeriaceae sp. PMI808]